MGPPTSIETERLVLRLPRLGDVPDIFEYASDPDVTRLMDWRCLSEPAQVLEFLGKREEKWRDGSELSWLITERGVDRVIGGISVRPRASDADFGYVLHRAVWGRGIAVEAARAMLDWLRSARGTTRIWATCDTENQRSARVLEKLGLKRERVLPAHTVRPNISPQPRDSYLYATGDAR